MEEKEEGPQNLDMAEFRHSMFQALEKYGVLDKLRVHLRSLMVNLIKGFQIGHDPFPQHRLEPKNQALNVLIAEYLLHQQYTYSLSVFASEIPLSTTVFDYGSTLFDMSAKFEESDSWKFISLNDKDIALVFNAMGVNSDSNFVNNVYSMYKSTLPQSPLLCCMLRLMPGCNVANVGTLGASVVGFNELKSNELEDDSKISIRSSYLNRNNKSDKTKMKVNQSPTRKKILSPTANIRVQKSAKESTKPGDKTKNKNAGEQDKHILEEMYEELHLLYASELDLLRKKDQRKYKNLMTQREIEDRVERLEREEAIKKMQHQLQKDYEKKKFELENQTRKKKKSLTVLAGKLKEQQETLRGALKHLHKRTSSLGEKEKNLQKQRIASEQAMIKKSEQLQKRIQEKIGDLQKQMQYLERDKKVLYEEKLLIEKLKGVSISKHSGSQTFNDLETILPESSLKKYSTMTMLPHLDTNVPNQPTECEIQTDICDINSVLMEIKSYSSSEKDLPKSDMSSNSNIRVFGRDETIHLLNTRVSEIIRESLGLNVPKVFNNNLKNIKMNNTIIKEMQRNEMDPKHLKEIPKTLSNVDANTGRVKNKLSRAFLGKALKETLEFNSKLNYMVEAQKIQIENLRKLLREAQFAYNDGIQIQQLRRTRSFDDKPGDPTLNNEIDADTDLSGSQSDLKDTNSRPSRPKSSPISTLSQHSMSDMGCCGTSVGGSTSSGVYRSEDNNIQKQLQESRQTLRRLEIEAEVVEQCYQEYKERKRSSFMSPQTPANIFANQDNQNYIAPKVSWPHLLSVPAQMNLLSRQPEREKTCLPVSGKVENKMLTSKIGKPGLVNKPMDEFRKMYKLPSYQKCEDVLGDYYKIALSINRDEIENVENIAFDQTSISMNNELLKNNDFGSHVPIKVEDNHTTSHQFQGIHETSNKNLEKNNKLQEIDSKKSAPSCSDSSKVDLGSKEGSIDHIQNIDTKDDSDEIDNENKFEEISTKRTYTKLNENKKANNKLSQNLLQNKTDEINTDIVSTITDSAKNSEDIEIKSNVSNNDKSKRNSVSIESKNDNQEKVQEVELNEDYESTKNTASSEKSENSQHELSQRIDERYVNNYSDEEFDDSSKATSSAMSIGNVSERFWN